MSESVYNRVDRNALRDDLFDMSRDDLVEVLVDIATMPSLLYVTGADYTDYQRGEIDAWATAAGMVFDHVGWDRV